MIKNDEIYWGKEGKGRPGLKRFLIDVKKGEPLASIWSEQGSNRNATREIEKFFGTVEAFDTAKPTKLLKTIIQISTNKNSKILDFFAGSGATGDAVLQINKEDDGNRQFFVCTNNENNICTEVCHPRLKKTMMGYAESNGEKHSDWEIL